MIELRGMTWDHSRGVDPMIATAVAFTKKNPEVVISWEKRSLQAFADRPIAAMADEYDMMVIDHPHVGEVARTGSLLAFDGIGRDAELAQLAKESVGVSHLSYEFDGRQWSLAIDAATPVAAFRPDLLDEAPTSMEQTMDLARDGQVAFALIPLNSLMTYFGLLRNCDCTVAEGDQLSSRDTAAEILNTMCELVKLIDPRCLELDPIGIYDWLGSNEKAPAYSPFGYGYTNYSRAGYRSYPLCFADAPGFADNGPRGTVIGGTGIAISSKCHHPQIAYDYSFWIASSECQRTLYYTSGGQPGNAVAWEDKACNTNCLNFFHNTRNTLETAWLRPRYAGYMQLQEEGGDLVFACVTGKVSISKTIDLLQEAYVRSRAC